MNKINPILQRLAPFFGLGILIFFMIFGLILLFYILIFGTLIGVVCYGIAFIRQYFTKRKQAATGPRIINAEHYTKRED